MDLGVINWYLPPAKFHACLQRLIGVGFGKRIMFSSDQMVWPDAIGESIERVESAPFLTDEQRRDIMCRNAARFFRFGETICR